MSYLRGAYGERTGITVTHSWEWASRTSPIILDWVLTPFPYTPIQILTCCQFKIFGENVEMLFCNKWLYLLNKLKEMIYIFGRYNNKWINQSNIVLTVTKCFNEYVQKLKNSQANTKSSMFCFKLYARYRLYYRYSYLSPWIWIF